MKQSSTLPIFTPNKSRPSRASAPVLLAGVLVALLSVGVLLGGAKEAAAQGKCQPKVIELKDEVIKGRVQKPEAFYILQHASLNYERLDAKESFIPELLETVTRKPF